MREYEEPQTFTALEQARIDPPAGLAAPCESPRVSSMSWKDETDEIHRRRALSLEQGGAESVARHHNKGKLTIRERIDALLDEDYHLGDLVDSYCHEYGLLVRPLINVCIMSPPLIITHEQVDELVAALRKALLRAQAELMPSA